MTKIETIILKINKELISTFALLDEWFDQPDDRLFHQPDTGWSAAQILEHVMLTNHYLLLMIEKGVQKALRKSAGADLASLLRDYEFYNAGLEAVSDPQSFQWQHPQHMTPVGELSLADVRYELRDQLYRCLCLVEKLSGGEGILHTMALSVNKIGKLDVYQYLHFLTLHAQRHLHQLQASRYSRSSEHETTDLLC